MRFWLLFLFALVGFSGFATHNRSGYISYCYNPQTNKYDFRIYTYTSMSTASQGADRCEQVLYICDLNGNLGDSLVCPRINGTASCPNGGSGVDGVQIVAPSGSYGGVKANVYAGSLQLNPGYYTLTLIDPNRDQGIINLGGASSSQIAFALIDTMYAYGGIVGAGTNCTPTITNPPIQNACAGSPWCYNPGAVDAENDSLDFSLTKSFMDDPNKTPQGVIPISFETFPSGLTVNRETGTLCWNTPQIQGEYNFALLIREYRKNPLDGKRYIVSATVFDIQVLVIACPPNNITFQNPPHDTCVVAGTSFSTSFTVTSTGTTPPMNLTATGLPFTSTNIGQQATPLNATSSTNDVSGTFSWSPDCNAVQFNPYQITLQASDSNTPLANANFSTFNIHVVSPPPSNVLETQVGDSIKLDWTAPLGCSSSSIRNPIQKYLIYRIDGCTPFTPSVCETGVPFSSGYTLIGITTSGITTFMDTNLGNGFPPGYTYSYIVVAYFADGSFSMASANSCITTKLDVPLMMKVSVDTTDASVGKMLVWWNKPLTNAGNFDTTIFPGPYQYVLNQRAGSTGTFVPTYTVGYANYAQIGQLNNMTDTYSHTNINTIDTQYYYKVDFYYTNVGLLTKIGSSAKASSVFLKVIPHDKKVILTWSHQVPWSNIKYYILQQRTGGANANYDIVDSTTTNRDTIYNLTNGQNYCFKILAKGEYANPLIQKYLWNYSQKVCASPKDDESPCQPQLTVTGNCNSSVNKLIWTNPNHTCNSASNDIIKYYIYYAAYQDSSLKLVDSLLSANDTSYTTDFSYSIAGCYVVVAVDSVGNRSPLTNQMCTDNCPEYELPNVFTPNGDNTNDQYIPVKNKYIKDVEFIMYNRWGEVVFETSDPALKWDGKSKQMKQPVSDGTYFYTCIVRELHYYGIKERKLKGFVQVLH